MSQDTLKAYEAAVSAEAEAGRKLKQAQKDLEFCTRKLPRMQQAHDEAVAATTAARNALTAPAAPAAPAKPAK